MKVDSDDVDSIHTNDSAARLVGVSGIWHVGGSGREGGPAGADGHNIELTEQLVRVRARRRGQALCRLAWTRRQTWGGRSERAGQLTGEGREKGRAAPELGERAARRGGIVERHQKRQQ